MVDNFLPPDFVEKSRREAVQASVLYEISQTVANVLNTQTSLITVDSILFERFHDLSSAFLWHQGVHRDWINANLRFALAATTSVVFRFIVVPYPYAIRNSYKRQLLKETIIEHVHFHLWHGVTCGVLFLDPNIVSRETVTDITFLSIPHARIFFDTPNYHEADTRGGKFSDRRYDLHNQRIHEWLSQRTLKPIWLFYEDAHYSYKRLRGWHWSQLRRFFVELNRNERCPGPGCATQLDNTSVALDHIGPISETFPQTIRNFQLLCRKCNERKGRIVPVDPFVQRVHFPDLLNSEALKLILRHEPSWLGTIRRPSRITSELYRASGLYQ